LSNEANYAVTDDESQRGGGKDLIKKKLLKKLFKRINLKQRVALLISVVFKQALQPRT